MIFFTRCCQNLYEYTYLKLKNIKKEHEHSFRKRISELIK